MPQKDAMPGELRAVIQKMIDRGDPPEDIRSVMRAYNDGSLKLNSSGDIPSSGPSSGPEAPPPKYTGPDTFWGGVKNSLKWGGDVDQHTMKELKEYGRGAVLDIPNSMYGMAKNLVGGGIDSINNNIDSLKEFPSRISSLRGAGKYGLEAIGNLSGISPLYRSAKSGAETVGNLWDLAGKSGGDEGEWGRTMGQLTGQPIVMEGAAKFAPPVIRAAGGPTQSLGRKMRGAEESLPPYTIARKFRWGGRLAGGALDWAGGKMREVGLNPEQLRDLRLETSPHAKYTPSSELPRDLTSGETVVDPVDEFRGGPRSGGGGGGGGSTGGGGGITTTPEQDLVDKMLAWDRTGASTKYEPSSGISRELTPDEMIVSNARTSSINELGRQFNERIPEGTDLGFKKGTRRQPQLPFDDVPSGSPWSGPDKPPSTPRLKRGPKLPFEGSESGVGPESPEGELVATPDGGFKWVSKSEVRSQVGGREPGPSTSNDEGIPPGVGPSESWKASWTKLNKMLGRDPSAAEIEADMARAPKEGEKTGQVAGFPPKFDDPSREWYQLPNGQIIPVDSTATKGVKSFDFQMKGGETVKAVRIDQPEIEPHGMYGPEYKGNPRTNATDKFGPKPEIPPTDKWDAEQGQDKSGFTEKDLRNGKPTDSFGEALDEPQNDISGVRTRNTLGPREVTPSDTPVQPRMGQQELPWSRGEKPSVDEYGIPQGRDWTPEDIFRINHEMKNAQMDFPPGARPAIPPPPLLDAEQMHIPEIGDAQIQHYLGQEDATPPEMVDLPKHSPDKLTLMQRLRDMLDQEEYA